MRPCGPTQLEAAEVKAVTTLRWLQSGRSGVSTETLSLEPSFKQDSKMDGMSMEGGHQIGPLRGIKSENPTWRPVPQVLGLCCHHGSLSLVALVSKQNK